MHIGRISTTFSLTRSRRRASTFFIFLGLVYKGTKYAGFQQKFPMQMNIWKLKQASIWCSWSELHEGKVQHIIMVIRLHRKPKQQGNHFFTVWQINNTIIAIQKSSELNFDYLSFLSFKRVAIEMEIHRSITHLLITGNRRERNPQVQIEIVGNAWKKHYILARLGYR